MGPGAYRYITTVTHVSTGSVIEVNLTGGHQGSSLVQLVILLWQVIAHFEKKKFIILSDTLLRINIMAKGNFLLWLFAIGSTPVPATP